MASKKLTPWNPTNSASNAGSGMPTAVVDGRMKRMPYNAEIGEGTEFKNLPWPGDGLGFDDKSRMEKNEAQILADMFNAGDFSSDKAFSYQFEPLKRIAESCSGKLGEMDVVKLQEDIKTIQDSPASLFVNGQLNKEDERLALIKEGYGKLGVDVEQMLNISGQNYVQGSNGMTSYEDVGDILKKSDDAFVQNFGGIMKTVGAMHQWSDSQEAGTHITVDIVRADMAYGGYEPGIAPDAGFIEESRFHKNKGADFFNSDNLCKRMLELDTKFGDLENANGAKTVGTDFTLT